MSQEEKHSKKNHRVNPGIGDIVPNDIKEALQRLSSEGVPQEKKEQQEKIIPKEITSLEPGDLIFYAGEQGYAEYFIVHKDIIDEELLFTIQQGKRNSDGEFEEIPRKEIPAKTFANWFHQKSLVFSRESEHLTSQQETEMVIQNLEDKKTYHLNNKERNPEYQKTLAFMDQLIQERSTALTLNNLNATENIISEMQKGLQLHTPNTPGERFVIKEFDIMKQVIESKRPVTKETFHEEEAMKKIAELFADPKFSFPMIATHGAEFRGKKGKELRKEYPEGFQLTPDTDAQVALELLQESLGMTVKNTQSEQGSKFLAHKLEKNNLPSQVILVPKGQYVEGAINIDTGGRQGIVLEQKTNTKGSTVNTIWIDHHGAKKEILTSATSLMLKFVKQIPQLKFKHEAQERQWKTIADFITDIDNITFKTNAKFIREDYAKTLYGLYKHIPTQDLVRELKNTGSQKVYSDKDLGEKGWLPTSNSEQFKVKISLGDKPGEGGIEDIKKQMVEKRFSTTTPELGTYLFENYREYDTYKNKPKNPLGFVGVKASGMDSHITLQPGGGFFMSSTKDMEPVYNKLITAIPEIKDIAVLVRGTMIVYDPRRLENSKSVTEREIMNALDLHKKVEHKKPEQKVKRPIVKKHIPGQRREDVPLPAHVQEFLTLSGIKPNDLRFHTLNSKSVMSHFDPKVKLLSEQQRKFIDIVKEVAEKLNIKANTDETLDSFIKRLQEAA